VQPASIVDVTCGQTLHFTACLSSQLLDTEGYAELDTAGGHAIVRGHATGMAGGRSGAALSSRPPRTPGGTLARAQSTAPGTPVALGRAASRAAGKTLLSAPSQGPLTGRTEGACRRCWRLQR
jgi:hypothetical protein